MINAAVSPDDLIAPIERSLGRTKAARVAEKLLAERSKVGAFTSLQDLARAGVDADAVGTLGRALVGDGGPAWDEEIAASAFRDGASRRPGDLKDAVEAGESGFLLARDPFRVLREG